MIIAPSVMSMNFINMKPQLDVLESRVEWLHYDVIDGHFANGMTIGPTILSQLKKASQLFLDVHLMVNEPEKFFDDFIKAGADSITFHYENYKDIDRCLEMIDYLQQKGVKAAIAINPDTAVETVRPLLNKADMILVMAVFPGFRDSHMNEAIEKIKELASIRKENSLKYLIQVDGGVNAENMRLLLQAGCDSFVAGGFTFKGVIEDNIALMRRIEAEVNNQ